MYSAETPHKLKDLRREMKIPSFQQWMLNGKSTEQNQTIIPCVDGDVDGEGDINIQSSQHLPMIKIDTGEQFDIPEEKTADMHGSSKYQPQQYLFIEQPSEKRQIQSPQKRQSQIKRREQSRSKSRGQGIQQGRQRRQPSPISQFKKYSSFQGTKDQRNHSPISKVNGFSSNNLRQREMTPRDRSRSRFPTPSKRQDISILNSSRGDDSKITSLKKRDIFVDISFPANQLSLSGQYGKQYKWLKAEWRRISEIMVMPDIFLGITQSTDIVPGELGNCYFFCALSALAERPSRVKKIFITKEVPDKRRYVLKLYYKGVEKHVQLDEWIPCLDSLPFFTRSKDNQLWVILIEKAWAKLYSSYRRIEFGYPEEPLHDLTGAPIVRVSLRSPSFSKEKVWEYLVISSRSDYVMIATSLPASDRNKSEANLLYGHAYTILGVTYMKFKGQSIKIVQLRNPWKNIDTNPKTLWAAHDPNWDLVNQKEKERIGFTKNFQTGLFFMSYDDFLKEFVAVTVAEVIQSAEYSHLSKADPENKGVFFAIEVYEQGLYNLQINKTPQKSYSNNAAVIRKIARKSIQFSYPVAKLQIGQYDRGIMYKETPAYSPSRQRALYVNYNLRPGRYIAHAQINFDRSTEEDYDVTLSAYSFYKCKITFATYQQAVDISGNTDIDWAH